MDPARLLYLLLDEANRFAVDDDWPHDTLEETLFELNTRKPVDLPGQLPKDHAAAIGVLREALGNNVTLISCALHWYWPEKYFFYRVSKLEPEIFAGLSFLSDLGPDLAFDFPGIGRGARSVDRYLELNEVLGAVMGALWPEENDPHRLQSLLNHLLHKGLGTLFGEFDDAPHYWIMATREQYWHELDTYEPDDLPEWSARKELQEGDLIFLYRTSPVSGITDVFRAVPDLWFDCYGAWDGFWVPIDRVTTIPAIPFRTLKDDPVLGEWGLVRRSFQGCVTEAIPYAFYNRLLELIPRDLRESHDLEPEEVVITVPSSGMYTSEEDFDQKFMAPLLSGWGFKIDYQHTVRFRAGGQTHPCRIDFLVSDSDGVVTLTEDKVRIANDDERAKAVLQAKSYALQLGLGSFVVASPEGLWVYVLKRNREELVDTIELPDLASDGNRIRDLLLKLR